jgi:uncharacterized protein with HEPN domain
VTRCIEVIGEAARSVSSETREKAKEIPWQTIVGMRNVLAHEYGSVVLRKVYEIVIDSLPALHDQIMRLITVIEKDSE